MILTTAAYVERRNSARTFDFDDAQTVASWWYSPAQPALVALATADKVLPSLYREVEIELEDMDPSSDREDLTALLEWAKENS